MNHTVFYQRKLLFNGIMHLLGYLMSFLKGKRAIRGNFNIHIHFCSKKPRMQHINMQHAGLF